MIAIRGGELLLAFFFFFGVFCLALCGGGGGDLRISMGKPLYSLYFPRKTLIFSIFS